MSEALTRCSVNDFMFQASRRPLCLCEQEVVTVWSETRQSGCSDEENTCLKSLNL